MQALTLVDLDGEQFDDQCLTTLDEAQDGARVMRRACMLDKVDADGVIG